MTDTEKIFPPSKIIKKLMDERGLTQTDIAVITGRYPSEISNYLSKEKINPKFAKELALVLGETPEFWLNLETKYRLSLEDEIDSEVKRRNKFVQEYPIKDMQKRGWISKSDDLDLLTPEIEKLIQQGQKLENVTSFKRTIKDEELNPAEKFWLYRAIQLASRLPVEKYDERRLNSLLTLLRKAAKSSKAVHEVAGLLQRNGIRFVVVEPLPKAKIDGAAFWLDENSPVVALSIRFDNIGSFWFALIHELTHIKHRDSFSMDNLQDSPIDEIEKRANREAAEFLVPQDKLSQFIKTISPYYSKAVINNFATKVNVHPGIIVGQLQHRGEIEFSKHRDFLVEVRALATKTAFTDGWGNAVPVA